MINAQRHSKFVNFITYSTFDTIILDIDLWHKILGHVSTTVLNQLLPIKSKVIADTIAKCEGCPCAKHVRLPFSISYTKTSTLLTGKTSFFISCIKTSTLDTYGHTVTL